MRVLPLLLLLSACTQVGDTGDQLLSGWEEAAGLDAPGLSLTASSTGWLAGSDRGLLESTDLGSWAPADTTGLPERPIRWLGSADGVDLAWAEGRGLYRRAGGAWEPAGQTPLHPLVSGRQPRYLNTPFGLDGEGGELWLATIGGLFRSGDGGASWDQAVIPATAGLNLLFTDVAVEGEQVVVTAIAPAGVLPSTYADLLSAVVFLSDDGGESFDGIAPDAGTRYPAAAAIDPAGAVYLATLDEGVVEVRGGELVGLGGPVDAVDAAWRDGGLDVASASRGVWRWQDGEWTVAGHGPVMQLSGGAALGEDGTVWRLAEGVVGGPPPEDAGATVYIALSFHVNLYHSYRGDTNDHDGYGIDIEVMERTVEWLEAYPEVHGDWDIENHFSLDGWLQTDGRDVLDDIVGRVQAGQDGLRLMSWNNGAVAAQTREEFDLSVDRAIDSYLAEFGGFDPGVQPQENMWTPEHVGWYADHGVEWITLFYSATGFTALRQDHHLLPEAWYAPLSMTAGDDELTLVPVYHHGDVIDHGGLRGWVRQIHATHAGDQLLVVHFDADAESWQTFDRELASLSDLDFVEYTTIQDYLDAHAPVAAIDVPHDQADGSGDGWQSWGEKDVNHRLATAVFTARERAHQARALAPEATPGLDEALDEALEPRVLALSTTHFGLAAPYLHEDRVASAWAYADAALAASDAALALAEAAVPLAPGEVQVLEHRGSAGAALVGIELRVPAVDWSGPDGVHLSDGDGELVVEIEVVDDAVDPVEVVAWVVVELEAGEDLRLGWSYDDTVAPATGTAPEDDGVVYRARGPFLTTDGVVDPGLAAGASEPIPGPRGAYLEWEEPWSWGDADEHSQVVHTVRRWTGLPGQVVQVRAELAEPPDPLALESVALSPFSCDGPADGLTWRTFGGAVHTRPIRPHQETWNPSAIDGWFSLGCTDGGPVQISHRVTERTSLAIAPLRTTDGEVLVAPLGTLWGDIPRHDARRTGGHGAGEVVVAIVGSQFHPAAPDWSGASVGYTLLVGDGSIDEGTLDLFAHPPLVRVGE